MKPDLPEPAAYYRPTRARELRAKAARLEGLAVCCGIAALLAILAIPGAVIWLAGDGDAAVGLAGLAAALAVLVAGLGGCGALRQRACGVRDQADALEAEHEARHGALPASEEPSVITDW